MKYLLDTHAFIWFISGSIELSDPAKKAIEHNDSTNYISIASIWEMAIKVSLNKLELEVPFKEVYKLILKNGFEILPVTFQDTLVNSTLPFHHRDPFDRIIVAQALVNRLTVISKDPRNSFYTAKIVW